MVNIKENKLLYLLLITLLIFVLNPFMALAQDIRVFDDANLYSDEEIAMLEEETDLLANNYEMDIIIVTTDDAQGKTSRDYADDYFLDNEFGLGSEQDGILFLIDMDNREAYILKSGSGIKYLTDQRVDNILALVLDRGLSNGEYYKATLGFLDGTEEYLKSGIPSNLYLEEEKVETKKSLTLMESLISIGAGLLASVGFFFGTKSKYKMKNPVKPETFRENSIVNLVSKDDILVDTVLTDRIVPKASKADTGKSTTHTTSSGKKLGGGGTKF